MEFLIAATQISLIFPIHFPGDFVENISRRTVKCLTASANHLTYRVKLDKGRTKRISNLGD